MTKPAPDQHHRDAVVALRDKNVIVDAGAGTGKTTLIVARIVDMVAPTDENVTPVPLDRIAAVTFTRRAAGELKLRLREKLLSLLADSNLGEARRRPLHEALSTLDTAYVGTIHSFADRLLRLRPVEARLSPAYEIAEDIEPLVRDTFAILLHASETATLDSELAGTDAAHLAAAAMDIMHDVFAVGLRLDTSIGAEHTTLGLDAVIEEMILHRDVAIAAASSATFDLSGFRRLANEFVSLAVDVDRATAAGEWFASKAEIARGLLTESDVRTIARAMRREFSKSGELDKYREEYECGGCPKTIVAAQKWKGGGGQNAPRDQPLREEWRALIDQWLAHRIVGLAPVVIAIYERVKARHRVVDQIDLLLQLRNLLLHDKTVRAQLQARFDHLFIDEFQDTDPLQAEIALLLCEDGAHADDPWGVRLRAGKLTVVGDPKQSIYRFRRADVATYDRVRRKLLERNGYPAPLTANFRSSPGLIAWVNDRFANILGRSPDGSPFDATRGAVYHADLVAAREGSRQPDVRVLSVEVPPDHTRAEQVRAAEGRAISRWLRWFVEHSNTLVEDPLTHERRPVRYGDIAVLATVTPNLPLLFAAMNDEGVPYSSAGGTLFLQDKWHRQFILGLRALADRDDGVAEAALMRPPFFSIDLRDLAWLLVDEGNERAVRARHARELANDLRKRRFDRCPGATARDLLERTAFARTIALGPNGAQRLQHLRELCLEVDTLADREGLDFDGVTAVMRLWIDQPIQLEAPEPMDGAAVRVTTVHQAKGLEFPVVVLWDSRQLWSTPERMSAWTVDRTGRSWSIAIEGLKWEEPSGAGLTARAQTFADAERRRVVYVAATRARDVLVVTTSATSAAIKYVNSTLDAGVPSELVSREPPYSDARRDVWPAPMPARVELPLVPAADEDWIRAKWTVAAQEAVRPRMRSVAVSAAAKADPETSEVAPLRRHPRPSRFGATFGTAVHRAIALALERSIPVDAAVARAARECGLAVQLDEAAADVTRTIAALRREALLDGAFRLEYPIAGAGADGSLLVGAVDFVAEREGALVIVDFKSDRAPSELDEVPEYLAQVTSYARLMGGNTRIALLFTEDGTIRWIS